MANGSTKPGEVREVENWPSATYGASFITFTSEEDDGGADQRELVSRCGRMCTCRRAPTGWVEVK
jgi:hypothetical protein